MKKLHLIFFSIFILCSINLFAQDSTRVEKDSYNVPSKKLNFSVLGGAGLILDEADFGEYFETTPMYVIGLEYPLTKSGNWSINGNLHFWKAMSKSKVNETVFYKFSDNYFGQLASNIQVNWYYLEFGGISSSIHLGYYFSLLNHGTYSGLNLGLNFGYKISNCTNILLEYNRWGYGGDEILNPFPSLLNSINLKFKYNVGILI